MGSGMMVVAKDPSAWIKLHDEAMVRYQEQRRQIMERAFAISLKGMGNTTQLFDGYLDMSTFQTVEPEPTMETLDELLGELTMEEAIADMRKTVDAIPEKRA